jgi:type VI protein secretion system component VasK
MGLDTGVGTLVGAGIGVVLGTLINSILIWIIGKLGLGMKVDGFGSALAAGFFIALGAAIAAILWGLRSWGKRATTATATCSHSTTLRWVTSQQTTC